MSALVSLISVAEEIVPQAVTMYLDMAMLFLPPPSSFFFFFFFSRSLSRYIFWAESDCRREERGGDEG